MPISNLTLVTIACNGPECDKSVTFEGDKQEQAFKDNDWLQRTWRRVITPDNRQLVYCGDICEIKGIESGAHNKPEPKKIATAATPAQIQQAVEAAQREKAATSALKSGGPVTLG